MKKGKDCIGVGCWGIITNNKNQILLLKRKDKDYWERPGGKVELGESLEESVAREVFEEAGIKVEVIGFVMFDQTFLKDQGHWISFCYHLKSMDDNIKNVEKEKHADVQWFDVTDLPESLSSHTKKALEFFLKK